MGIDSGLLYAPCPCGSGLKFKFCCYRAVRGELPPCPTQADVTTAVRRHKQPFGMVNDVDPVEDREALELVWKGIAKREERQYPEAVALFRKARDAKPNLYTAWNNEATCLWLCGRFEAAIDAQEKGLERSADVNAFGWAQLAEMRYFLGDDPGAAEAVDKGAVLEPLSDDAATKVCSALAHLRRHGQLLSYARASGFDQTPWVAFYAGIAALNLGNRGEALQWLGTAASGEEPSPFAVAMYHAASVPGMNAETPSGEWLYFLEENYGAGPLWSRALEDREPRFRNAVCDIVEIMLCMRELDKDGALEILKPYRGGRAGILRDGLSKTRHFDEIPGGGNEGPDMEAELEEFRKDNPGFEATKLSMSVVPGGRLDDPGDEALFQQAGADFSEGKPGGRRWARAKSGFRKLLGRHPDFFRAEFNLAVMAEREGNMEEADALLAKITSEHPDYAFAQAALVRRLLQKGEVERAGRVVEEFTVPAEMNPVEYRAWLCAVKLYFETVDDDIRAGNTADAIKRIEKTFGL